jgi:ribosomal protein S18 acetylase RimI-like enzyme
MNLRCRSETPDDEPFIRELMIETLTGQLAAWSWPEEVRGPLLDAQYRIRRRGFCESAGGGPGIIVLAEGEPVAWYVAADSTEEIRLVNLVVRTEHRGKGIGSAILRQLVTDSDRSSRRLRLSVAVNNRRASQLYARFGFQRTGGDGVHDFMERPVGPLQYGPERLTTSSRELTRHV